MVTLTKLVGLLQSVYNEHFVSMIVSQHGGYRKVNFVVKENNKFAIGDIDDYHNSKHDNRVIFKVCCTTIY